MTPHRAVAVAILASIVLATVRPAVAIADDEGLAAKSFREGEAAFSRREYAPAALAFERAARLVPHPSPWLNAAEAWEKAGDLLRAAEDCDRALALPDVDAAFAAAARERLGRLERTLARLRVEGDARFRVRLDDGSSTDTPLTRRLEAGRHHLVWTWSGEEPRVDHELWIELARGESKTVDLGALVEPTDLGDSGDAGGEIIYDPVRVEPEPPFLAQVPTGSWIALGVGAAAIVGGATFGGLTLSAQHAYEDAPTAERADTFFARRRITNVAFGVAGAAVLTGALLWIFDDATANPAAEGESAGQAAWTETFSFQAGPDGASVAAGLRY